MVEIFSGHLGPAAAGRGQAGPLHPLGTGHAQVQELYAGGHLDSNDTYFVYSSFKRKLAKI